MTTNSTETAAGAAEQPDTPAVTPPSVSVLHTALSANTRRGDRQITTASARQSGASDGRRRQAVAAAAAAGAQLSES